MPHELLKGKAPFCSGRVVERKQPEEGREKERDKTRNEAGLHLHCFRGISPEAGAVEKNSRKGGKGSDKRGGRKRRERGGCGHHDFSRLNQGGPRKNGSSHLRYGN